MYVIAGHFEGCGEDYSAGRFSGREVEAGGAFFDGWIVSAVGPHFVKQTPLLFETHVLFYVIAPLLRLRSFVLVFSSSVFCQLLYYTSSFR